VKNIMLDIETMGAGPDAAIIAIGAVSFSPVIFGSRFYELINLESAVDAGGVMDASTVLWWLEQNDDARKALTGHGVSMVKALTHFNAWCQAVGVKQDLRVWGNGSDFDNVILGTTYDRLGMARPWHYFNNRCYRTVKNLYPNIKITRAGTHHNALDDAENQANHLMDIFNHEKKYD
jgi:exodeoxyribonuclease VIII